MELNERQVYVLDDEEGIRVSLQFILVAEGYEVKTFAMGKELLADFDALTEQAPAVALVDLHLPDVSGVEVMRRVKERSPETEVVMLTGNPDASSAIQSVNTGAYAYILKPYNIDDLKALFTRIFEKQHLVRDNRELTQKLRVWNSELEEEVYRRTMDLQESNRKLQSLLDMRTQFITIMSHELRTPATALIGFADTLKEKWSQLPQNKIREYLDVIESESHRMVQLMSEIFEVSRIQEGRMELDLSAADVGAEVRAAVNQYRERYPSVAFALSEASGPLAAKLDRLYFKSALGHLLMNAVKYTPPEGSVRVSVERKGGHAEVRVEDEGPGVPLELREKVFEPFFRQMDDVNRKTPGAGLGLTIARGIVERMSGSVRVESRSDGHDGCSAQISLPVETPS